MPVPSSPLPGQTTNSLFKTQNIYITDGTCKIDTVASDRMLKLLNDRAERAPMVLSSPAMAPKPLRV